MPGWSDIWSGSDLVSGGSGGLGGYSDIGGWTDIFGGGGGGGGIFDWTDSAQGIYDGITGGDSGGGGWMETIGNLFGGGDGGGGGGYGDIFGAMLGGLGGAAQAFLDKDAVREMGKEQRRNMEFGAALEDYYKQQDTARKRLALDTYGQFSLMDRWAPNYKPAPPVQTPGKPNQ